MLGAVMIGAGAGLVAASLIAARLRPQPRVTGFSQDDIELLTMPAHERVARQIARFNGAPEFMWRRYTALAVTMILQRNP